MAFIYVITNDINGKQYVGKTNNTIEERFKEHIADSKKSRCEKRPLYSAMNKYGVEHFHIQIVEECSIENSANREIYWIDKLQTYGHNGYNATRGGDSKSFYNHQQIKDYYVQTRSFQQTAQKFNCDFKTVMNICKEFGVEWEKGGFCKPIPLIAVSTIDDSKIFFDSITNAAEYCIENKLAKGKKKSVVSRISIVLTKERPFAYNFLWYKNSQLTKRDDRVTYFFQQ